MKNNTIKTIIEKVASSDKDKSSSKKNNELTKQNETQNNSSFDEKKRYDSVKSSILSRRSVRSYSSYKPPYRLIFDIVNTATSTPRPGNIVPFHTIIVQDKEVITTVANLSYQQSWITQAPYLLIITSDQTEMNRLYPDISQRFTTQTSASYITNILLLCEASGLGCCWVESMQEEILKDYLNIPQSCEIHAILPVGYSKETTTKPSSPSIINLISFDSYGNKQNKN